MNTVRCFVALAFLAFAAGSRATAQPAKLPDRPAAAVTNWNGSWLPVVGADGSAPIVNSQGTPVTVKGKSTVMLTPGSRYAGGFVTISDVNSTDVPRTNSPSEEVDLAETMQADMEPVSEVLRASLSSDIDIPAAYAVLIAYPVNPSPDSPQPLAVVLHSLGNLTAGTQLGMSVVLPKLGVGGDSAWSILIFSAGRQVRSTGMGRILPDYFDRIETFNLRRTLSQQVSKGADERISVFREMPLGLPATLVTRYHAKTINVEISVGADGRVSSARPLGVNDDVLANALTDGFSRWLFLPSIRHGVPEPGSVILPLKL
jgi:hypothetical protein